MRMGSNKFPKSARLIRSYIKHKQLTWKHYSRILGTILGDADIDPLGRMYCSHSLQAYLLCKCHQRGQKKKRATLVEPITPSRFARKHNLLSFARISIALAQNNFPWAQALAVWFMDDGGRNSARGVLDVAGLCLSSRLLLQQILESKFELNTTSAASVTSN